MLGMRCHVTRWFWLSIGAVVLLTGCAGSAPAQEAVKVARGDIVQTVSADGELSLPQQRKLSFSVSGKIDSISVEEGAKVTKGQALARLEVASLERAVSSAQLAVKSAEADRDQAEAGLRSSQADLKQAEIAVQSAKADQDQYDNSVKTAEANLRQAEYALKTAEANKDIATDSFRKITYPYTYSTFTLDIPEAVAQLGEAERLFKEASRGQQPGLTTEEYAAAARKTQEALDSLSKARQRLDRGQGADVFASGLLTVRDYWTLREAQLGMEKAQLGVDTAKGTIDMARLGVDNARNAALKARLGSQASTVALDKARAGVRNAEVLLDKTRVGVDVATNNFNNARQTLADATITAPFDGIIARVSVKTGDVLTVADYTRTIFELIDPRRMEFTIKVDEIDIPGVALGQDAIVSVDAMPGEKLKGKVAFVSPLPVVEGGVVQYQVKIGFDVPEGSPLKAGMSSSASIATSQRQGVLLVPTRAISRAKAGKPTVKLSANGQAEERAVTTGVSNAAETEVTSGLNEGDVVLVDRSIKK